LFVDSIILKAKMCILLSILKATIKACSVSSSKAYTRYALLLLTLQAFMVFLYLRQGGYDMSYVCMFVC